MYRFPFLLLLGLFLCTCGREPLSVKEVTFNNDRPEDGFTTYDLPADGVISETTDLLEEHGDLSLSVSFRLPKGSSASLLLQNIYKIDLTDMTVDGKEALLTADNATGYWHDLDLVFLAPTDKDGAILAEMYLDGNLLFYQLELKEAGTQAGPLTLSVDSGGPVELASMRYSDVAGTKSTIDEEGEVVLNVPLLAYSTYELGEDDMDFTSWDEEAPAATGYINRFHLSRAGGNLDRFALRFTGQLDVPKAGVYEFETQGPSKARLYLNGNLVVDQAGQPEMNKQSSITLEEGTQELAVEFIYPGGWKRFNINYQYEDESKKRLNSMEGGNFATPGDSEALAVEPDERPYILRSFIYYPAPKLYTDSKKRTHVVSVGEKGGPHYSVDLQTGALLQVWKGGFADVNQMWVGRGEPQIMQPIGPAVAFDESMQWTESGDNEWPGAPDDPDEDNFVHRVYELDELGRPTFFYRFDLAEVSDKIVPDNDGLIRELRHTGSGIDRYTQLAVADKITETSPGNFELRGPGMKISVESYDGEGLFKQISGGRERLIAQMAVNGHLRYRLDW